MNRRNRRNPFAFHPLMRKGGVHEKSKKAARQRARHETRRLASETRLRRR